MLERRLLEIVGDEKMYCESCAARVENALRRLAGVGEVGASHLTQMVELAYDPSQVTLDAVWSRLREMGYKAREV